MKWIKVNLRVLIGESKNYLKPNSIYTYLKFLAVKLLNVKNSI
jgi:hypothetical protein